MKLGNFGKFVKQYEKARRPYPQEVFSFLKSLLRVKSPKILDLGCGTGISARQLAKIGKVIGCDPDTRMLRAARAHNSSGVKYVVGSAEKLPFKDESFDVVAAFASFHWYSNSRALKEIKRTLKPGGIFYVVNQSGTKTWGQGYRRAIIRSIGLPIPDFKSAVYHPLPSLRSAGFGKIFQKNWKKTESYTLKNVLEYVQSVSIWNSVPDSMAAKALSGVEKHFQNILRRKNKIERTFIVKVKAAQK